MMDFDAKLGLYATSNQEKKSVIVRFLTQRSPLEYTIISLVYVPFTCFSLIA